MRIFVRRKVLTSSQPKSIDGKITRMWLVNEEGIFR